MAVIPARGGSVRVPFKNRRLFHGRPIIEYSIEAALASKLFDIIIVSTDDHEINRIARNAGVEVFLRSHDDGSRGTQEIVREVLAGMLHVDAACCVYPTSPLMDAAYLPQSRTLLDLRTAFVYTVCGWRDAAQIYWGHYDAFIERVPLDHWSTRRFGIGANRFCDINTEADWLRAEAMYSELHKGD